MMGKSGSSGWGMGREMCRVRGRFVYSVKRDEKRDVLSISVGVKVEIRIT
jgi:hypothetical protein